MIQKKASLFGVLALFLLTIGVLPALIVSISASRVANDAIRTEVIEYSQDIIQLQGLHISEKHAEINSLLNLIADNQEVKELLQADKQNFQSRQWLQDKSTYLSYEYAITKGIASIDIIRLDGLTVSTDRGISTFQPYEKTTIEVLLKNSEISPNHILHTGNILKPISGTSQIQSTSTMPVYASINSNPEPIGLIVVNYSVDLITVPDNQSLDHKLSWIVIVDNLNRVIYDEHKLWNGEPLPIGRKNIDQKPIGYFNDSVRGKNTIVNFFHVQPSGWLVLSLTPESVLTQKYQQINKNTGIILAGSILLSLISASLATVLVLRPLRKFSDIFQKIQNKSIEPETRLQGSAIKEIDDLATWFNAFLESRDLQRNTETALIESESRYRSLFDKSPVPLWEEDFSGILSGLADLDTGKLSLEEYLIRNPKVVVKLMSQLRVLDINRATLDLYKANSKEEVLANTSKMFAGVSIMELREEVMRMAARTQVFEHILENSTLTGDVIGIRLRWSVYPGYEKTMGRVIVSTQDITSQIKSEKLQGALLRISQAASMSPTLQDLYQSIHQILNTLMPAQNFYIASYDEDSGIVSFPYFVDQFDDPPEPRKFANGWTEYVIRTGKPLLLSPEIVDYLAEVHGIEEIGANSVDWLGVPLVVKDKTAGVLAVQTYNSGVRYTEEHRDLLMIVSAQVALSIDRKRAEEDLKFASTHDKLTLLYNRAYFEEEINRLNAGRRNPVSVIMIDVDGLKKVNDTYGHAAGDDLLKRTSKILHQAFRTDDMVARIGGDEFAIVLPETNEETVTASVERLMKCLNESNEADSEFKVGLSIGYATTSTDNQLSNVIREADQKMYAEKAEKKRKLDDIF